MSDRRYDPLNCGNCAFALQRTLDEVAAGRARAAGVAVPQLHCRLNPLPLAVAPTDFCGQHSEAQALRQLDLADVVSLAIVKQLQEPSARDTAISRLRTHTRTG